MNIVLQIAVKVYENKDIHFSAEQLDLLLNVCRAFLSLPRLTSDTCMCITHVICWPSQQPVIVRAGWWTQL